MLVLFETAAGFAIFKLLDELKLKNVENICEEFSTPEKAQNMLQLVTFNKFKDTSEALETINRLAEGKLSKTLKKALKGKASEHEELAVGDVKLGSIIKDKFNLPCVSNAATSELMRAIRTHIDSLLDEHKQELHSMSLALAHSLSRYKVKFNPEKIDTMIVQAVSLLDDIDKELNNYVMRCREWYGWHFPELGKLVQDHQTYAKVVQTLGMRHGASKCDLSKILTEDLEIRLKEEAEISMGTDISDSDLSHIQELCEQIIELTSYRTQLADYLKNRMMALAPNLTILLGELVGARLVSHAGSLIGLAKYPASTVQILGAEKALFRALKTKRDTPKYGLIYHAQLIGQASAKMKGKVARKLAAKVSLATRIDALADESLGTECGEKSRAYLELFIKSELERGPKRVLAAPIKHEPYQFKSEVFEYDASADSTIKSSKKRKFEEDSDDETPSDKRIKDEEPEEEEEVAEKSHKGRDKPSKKKKKVLQEEDQESD